MGSITIRTGNNSNITVEGDNSYTTPVVIGPEAKETILVWGDSISAGYGLDSGAGWVHLLEQRLQTQGRGYTVVMWAVNQVVRVPGELRRGATV